MYKRALSRLTNLLLVFLFLTLGSLLGASLDGHQILRLAEIMLVANLATSTWTLMLEGRWHWQIWAISLSGIIGMYYAYSIISGLKIVALE